MSDQMATPRWTLAASERTGETWVYSNGLGIFRPPKEALLLVEELVMEANRTTAGAAELAQLRTRLILAEETADAAKVAAERNYDEANRVAAELEQLRAAAPTPEPADVADPRAMLANAERDNLRLKIRAESAEFAVRCWAAGNGDAREVSLFENRSLGAALDETLRREGEARRELRAARADVTRLERELAEQIAATAAATLRAEGSEATEKETNETARRIIAEKNALLGERLTEIAHLRKELDAAERAAAPEEDPGAPLAVDSVLAVDSRPKGLRSVSVHRDGKLILSTLTLDDEEEAHLREMVRAYNVLNHDEGTEADRVVDQAIRAWGERKDLALARAIGARYAGCFEKKSDHGGLLEHLAASIALNEIKKASGTFRPATTTEEAVDRAIGVATEPEPERASREAFDRAIAPLRASVAAAQAGLAEIGKGWDQVVAEAIGPKPVELPVEGEIGTERCPGSGAASLYGVTFTCGRCGATSDLVNGKVPEHSRPKVRVLAECNYQVARKAVSLLASLPTECDAREAATAEEARLRAESMVIPSFSVGALWMWRRLTGRGGEA